MFVLRGFNMSNAQETLWDVDDLARYLKLKSSTVYKKKCKEKLPFVKVGGALRFRKTEIDQYLEAQRSGKSSQVPSQSRFQSARERLRSLKTDSSLTTRQK